MLVLIARYAYFLVPLLTVIWAVSNYLQRRLYKIPGPFLRGISSLPRIWSIYKGRSHDDDIALHRVYGPLVRIAPNTVSIRDPSAINTIYGIGTKFTKSPFYNLARTHDEQGLIPDPFVLTDKALHARMKKNAANAYSMNHLSRMESWIEPVNERLFQILDEMTGHSKGFDMAPVLRNYAMDSVFAITFGDDQDYLNRGDSDGFLRILELTTSYMAVLGQVAWIHPFLLGNRFVSRLVFGNSTPEAGMVSLAQSCIAAGIEKSKETDCPMTFLQILLSNQMSNPQSLTDREVMTHAFGNISAGSDTTATAMRSIVFNILKHRHVYDRLCKEVRDNLSLPVSWSQAKNLPYLSAVIQEGIRIHPSVGMMLVRTVPSEGATIYGQYLQAGVEVGINPWVVHHDPVVFKQPNRFWPERWLSEVSDENELKMMNRSFLAFGHGSHTCSGRWISIMETQKLIPSLLLRYDMELADDGRGYSFTNHWFTQQSGLNVAISKRHT